MLFYQGFHDFGLFLLSIEIAYSSIDQLLSSSCGLPREDLFFILALIKPYKHLIMNKLKLTLVLSLGALIFSCGSADRPNSEDQLGSSAAAMYVQNGPAGIISREDARALIKDFNDQQQAALEDCMGSDYAGNRTIYFTMADFQAYASKVSGDLALSDQNVDSFGMAITLGAKKNEDGKWENTVILVPVFQEDTSYNPQAPMLDYGAPYPPPPDSV